MLRAGAFFITFIDINSFTLIIVDKSSYYDKGYLSRVIKKLEIASLIERKISENDGRFLDITLTAEGTKAAQQLIEQTNLKMGKIIVSFLDEELEIINESMNKIMTIFEKEEDKWKT